MNGKKARKSRHLVRGFHSRTKDPVKSKDKKKPEPEQQAASTPVEKKPSKRVFNLVGKMMKNNFP